MPQNNWTKAWGYSGRFSSWPRATDQIVTLQQIFEKSWMYAKDIYACFDELEKAYDRVPREKLWGVLRKYSWRPPVTGRHRGLYFRSEVCARVGGVMSQPFTVTVGLRQGCVLSPLFFIVYMNWVDSHCRVDEGVTVRSYRINCLPATVF